jgi:hypothetical protein
MLVNRTKGIALAPASRQSYFIDVETADPRIYWLRI